jgi:hypothetical protein
VFDFAVSDGVKDRSVYVEVLDVNPADGGKKTKVGSWSGFIDTYKNFNRVENEV